MGERGKFGRAKEVKAYIVLFAVEVEKPSSVSEIPIVAEFPEVFLEDISELPPEQEVEFVIDLVPGVNPMSIAP